MNHEYVKPLNEYYFHEMYTQNGKRFTLKYYSNDKSIIFIK